MADDFFDRFTEELAACNPVGSVEKMPETISTGSPMASALALPGSAGGVGTRSLIGLGIVAAIVLALIVYIAGRM
jgi:hypothetical protein